MQPEFLLPKLATGPLPDYCANFPSEELQRGQDVKVSENSV